ncbi:MAG: SprT-like domain-containing protein [Pontiellaceae bacterium]|nr:SprT-like domain-containing protein [Pontiellaceae bacterium]
MPSKEDQLRACFAPGDPVQFVFHGKIVDGTLLRTNPKYALVQAGEDEFDVPYNRLISTQPELDKERIEKIESACRTARQLLSEHGLDHWTFKFDHGTRRAGSCNYSDQRITLSFNLARSGSAEEIHETLLHEIAHALVGKNHNHDAVWRAKAQAIGCTGERTHQMKFVPARWRVRCENDCWSHTAERRNPRLICKHCGGKLIYSANTPT